MTLFCLVVYSDIDDLFDVQKELIPVSAQWKNIGIALGLRLSILDGISAENSGDPAACLESVVAEWLGRRYNVERFGEPTWQRLVEVVGDPLGGGNTALAMDISMRHRVRGMSNRYFCCTLGRFHIL